MTVRDPEVLELLDDRPELLAIADAVSATQPRHAGWGSRRRMIGVAAVAAAIAVGIVAFLVAPEGRPGVVDRALAALGTGPITHVVAQGPTGTVYVELETGKRTLQQARLELWGDRQAHHLHLVLSVHGRAVAEYLWPQDKASGITPGSFRPDLTALWTGYRAALKSGKAEVERKASIDGHAVYWLRFAARPPDSRGTEVAVDAHSFKPVLSRTWIGSRHYDQRILVAEAIGYDPADFTHRIAGTARQESSMSVTPGWTTAVRAPWLSAGRTAAGLKLGSVNPLTVTTSDRGKQTTIHGIQLVYGPLDQGMATVDSTTIEELPRPALSGAWKVPAGSIEIGTGGSSGPSGVHLLWVGSLKTHGLYITIKTPVSEHALLTIARSLHPAS